MNTNGLYAFYGSLRKGMFNHDQFRHALRYQFTETLPEYRLHAMEHYPYAVYTGSSEDVLVAEVYHIVDPRVAQAIHDLELGVGYHYTDVMVRGMSTGIYLFKSSGPEPLVRGGDWVKFFGIVSGHQ